VQDMLKFTGQIILTMLIGALISFFVIMCGPKYVLGVSYIGISKGIFQGCFYMEASDQ